MKNQDIIIRCWLEPLRHSKRPLLDVSTRHGFHTATAICQSRDVIPVDEENVHVDLLRKRIQKVLYTGFHEKAPCHGRWIDSKAVKLPNIDVFSKCSATGYYYCKGCTSRSPVSLYNYSLRYMNGWSLVHGWSLQHYLHLASISTKKHIFQC